MIKCLKGAMRFFCFLSETPVLKTFEPQRYEEKQKGV
jgi:hypothetical protein